VENVINKKPRDPRTPVVFISDTWRINDLQAQYGLEQERRRNAGIRLYMKTAELSSSMHLLQDILTPEFFGCQERRCFALLFQI